jgi:FkbM family methyltransferase
MPADAPTAWTPPLSLEERLRRALVPMPLHVRFTAWRHMRRGERELRLLPLFVRPGSVAIDVGANAGVWSYWLSRIAGTVHAFEPNPKIYAILRAGALPRTQTYPVALSDTEGTAELLVPRAGKGYSNQGASLNPSRVQGEHGTVSVAQRRLDSYGFDDVSFMKIDVEGHEQAVIEGACATLARCKPTLIVEIEERHTQRPLHEQIAAVCAHGYAAFCLVRGVLTPFAALDVEAHQRRPATPGDYVFNFIFLPR